MLAGSGWNITLLYALPCRAEDPMRCVDTSCRNDCEQEGNHNGRIDTEFGQPESCMLDTAMLELNDTEDERLTDGLKRHTAMAKYVK
jgi:hypothetical protein